MDNLVQAKGLELGYVTAGKTVHAAGPADFVIRDGEALGLIGESGAGKSTLAYEVLGLLRWKGGRRLGGEISRHIGPDQMAYIPQDPLSSLDPLFSIGNQLREMSRDQERIQRVLAEVQLPLEKISLKSYPHELSGGMRQRLLIAMALLRGPRLLIADEPTSSLDVTLQAEIMGLFRQIKANGIAFLFVTHHLPLASALCDRVLVMQRGKIVEQGDPRLIFKNPRSPHLQMLVQSVPVLPA